jgi:peptide/nickel transport system ATP-binding protein
LQAQLSESSILSIKDLFVTFHTYAGDVKALNGVELEVRKGEILGLVGESGCGKSVTSLSIVGLLPPNAEVMSGEIDLAGKDLLKMSKEQIRKARITDVAMVFQDPMTYLNPVLTVGSQILEIIMQEPALFEKFLIEEKLGELDENAAGDALVERQKLITISRGSAKASRGEIEGLAKEYIVSILRQVRFPEPDKIFKLYPFELSGGMRQRAMIAMALVRRPKLLLADEMTTALDVTVQAEILELVKELKEKIRASVILVTHDLAVVAQVCDRVAVMYAGNIVEVADVVELFANPLHPYTKGLLAAIPRIGSAPIDQAPIKGSVPNLIFPPSGCRFNPRCPFVFEKCPKIKPPLLEAKPRHFVACLLYEKGEQTIVDH